MLIIAVSIGAGVIQAAPWAGDRPWWIAGTLAGVVILAAAFVKLMMRWTVIRGTTRPERRSITWRADVIVPEHRIVGAGAAPARPAIPGPPRPALGMAPKSWLCTTCYWVHPLTTPFCSLCGGSRAAHGAGREVIVRRAIDGA